VAWAMFFVYLVLTVILLLVFIFFFSNFLSAWVCCSFSHCQQNLLIALLNQSYTDIISQSKEEYMREYADVVFTYAVPLTFAKDSKKQHKADFDQSEPSSFCSEWRQ
jgi:hypothetical protein